ncbi:hypothetical protein MKW92_048587, partial [Papaver armeniacum]
MCTLLPGAVELKCCYDLVMALWIVLRYCWKHWVHPVILNGVFWAWISQIYAMAIFFHALVELCILMDGERNGSALLCALYMAIFIVVT